MAQPGTILRQCQRNAAADAAPCSGDDGDFSRNDAWHSNTFIRAAAEAAVIVPSPARGEAPDARNTNSSINSIPYKIGAIEMFDSATYR